MGQDEGSDIPSFPWSLDVCILIANGPHKL